MNQLQRLPDMRVDLSSGYLTSEIQVYDSVAKERRARGRPRSRLGEGLRSTLAGLGQEALAVVWSALKIADADAVRAEWATAWNGAAGDDASTDASDSGDDGEPAVGPSMAASMAPAVVVQGGGGRTGRCACKSETSHPGAGCGGRPTGPSTRPRPRPRRHP